MSVIVGSVACLGAQGIKVTYLEQTKVPEDVMNLPQEIRGAVESQLRQNNKTMCLYSYHGESVYAPASSASNPVSARQQGMSVQTISVGGGGVVYKNQTDRQLISQEYILDRQFLITEELNAPKWEFETAEKTIAGYKCRKAVSDSNTVAWYCPDIPVNDGPGVYSGLPGLIMEVEMPSKTVTAQTVELNYDTSADIKKPVSGNATSRSEFDNLRKKKMEEMGVPEGGGSGVRVIRM